MAVVDPDYASWLKDVALYATSTVAGAVAAYGENIFNSTVLTPIALKADAQTEADLQAAFLKGPLVRDRHVVKGARSDLIGLPITIKGDRLGYEGAGDVGFVIGVVEGDGVSTLTVLKRLAP